MPKLMLTFTSPSLGDVSTNPDLQYFKAGDVVQHAIFPDGKLLESRRRMDSTLQ